MTQQQLAQKKEGENKAFGAELGQTQQREKQEHATGSDNFDPNEFNGSEKSEQ